MSDEARWLVREVHNFGGFFGGDTVTLTATPYPGEDDETTLVIDEKALANVHDRHLIAPDMLLTLRMAGDRVDRAELLAAREWPVLHEALGDQPPLAPLAGPLVMAYHCATCDLWVNGAPDAGHCRVCGAGVEV